MGVVIDSTVLIDAERGRLDLDSLTAGHTGELFVSVISASELLQGIHRANRAELKAERELFVRYVLTRFPVLNIDLAVARIHAELAARLSARGSIIPAHDLWIAATCLTHGHSIATSNLRDFQRVPGLHVHAWGSGS